MLHICSPTLGRLGQEDPHKSEGKLHSKFESSLNLTGVAVVSRAGLSVWAGTPVGKVFLIWIFLYICIIVPLSVKEGRELAGSVESTSRAARFQPTVAGDWRLSFQGKGQQKGLPASPNQGFPQRGQEELRVSPKGASPKGASVKWASPKGEVLGQKE